MRIKFISIIVLLSFIFSIPARSQEQPDVTIITKPGLTIPYQGVLFSNKAYAELIAKQEAEKKLLEAKGKLDLQLETSKLRLSTATTSIAYNELERWTSKFIADRDVRIDKLTKQLADADKKTTDLDRIAWFLVGMGSVLLGGITVYYVTKKN